MDDLTLIIIILLILALLYYIEKVNVYKKINTGYINDNGYVQYNYESIQTPKKLLPKKLQAKFVWINVNYVYDKDYDTRIRPLKIYTDKTNISIYDKQYFFHSADGYLIDRYALFARHEDNNYLSSSKHYIIQSLKNKNLYLIHHSIFKNINNKEYIVIASSLTEHFFNIQELKELNITNS